MTDLGTQAHSAAQVRIFIAQLFPAFGIDPFSDQANHRIGCIRIKFGAIGIGNATDIASVFNNGDLHPQTDTQVGNFLFPGSLNCVDLTFGTPGTKAAGHQDAIHTIDQGVILLQQFRVDIADFHFGFPVNTGVNQSFGYRLVGVQQLHIFADHGDSYLTFGIHMAVDYKIPFAEIGLWHIHTKTVQHKLVEPLFVEHTGNLIDGWGIGYRNNSPGFNVGKQGNFLSLTLVDIHLGTTQQHIRLQADRAHLFNRMLGRLGFGLSRRGDVGHQGKVQQQCSLVTQLYL